MYIISTTIRFEYLDHVWLQFFLVLLVNRIKQNTKSYLVWVVKLENNSKRHSYSTWPQPKDMHSFIPVSHMYCRQCIVFNCYTCVLYYSGTPLSRTPLGNLFLSFKKRCPLFRGLWSTILSDLGPRQKCPFGEVSLIQGCPFRGVPLYTLKVYISLHSQLVSSLHHQMGTLSQ